VRDELCANGERMGDTSVTDKHELLSKLPMCLLHHQSQNARWHAMVLDDGVVRDWFLNVVVCEWVSKW
jgi:hypothetical protein